MSKKIISVLLSVALLLSLCTVMLSADEGSMKSPVMNKEYSALKTELSGFINSARGVIAKDDITPRLWQTEKLNERYLRARELLVKHKNAPETMENIVELENFLLGLFGGWDAEYKNDDNTYGAYFGGNLPYSPAQNAMYVRGWALDNYLARDPVYGYAKLMPVVGQTSAVTYREKSPAVIINVDGEDIIARGAATELVKDENGDAIPTRQDAFDPDFITNPGQYTYESWYNFTKKISEICRMIIVTPEFNGQSELQQNFVTRSYMQNKLNGYRDAYDALELIPSETDSSLSDAQKAEARQKNRLQSILRMMLEVWPEDAVKADYYVNHWALKLSPDKLMEAQDGSSTQEKLDQVNQWYADHELSYKVDVETDEIMKNEVRAWFEKANAVATATDITVEELLQYVNLRELYTDPEGKAQFVDEAEDPAKIRTEQLTWIEYRQYRNSVTEKYQHSIMSSHQYRAAKNAIWYQADADRTMQRYNSEEAKKAFDALTKSCEPGDVLLGTTDRYVSESEFWEALEGIMAAYEKLLPLRSNEPAHELIYKQIEAFMQNAANKPLYTEESWAALEAAVADYEAQHDIYTKFVESMNVTDAESAERLALAVDEINAKAYVMNEKYLTLELADVKVSNESILNAAREILTKAELAYNFLDGSDMPYTAAAFERFKTAYNTLKKAKETLEDELTKGALKLTYGDKDILAMIIELITAQTGLVYCPDTCND